MLSGEKTSLGFNVHSIYPVYQKHRSVQSHKAIYGADTLAHCQKVKEVGDLMTGELTTEALVNGGCNYNGSKVVKFLVE